MPSPPLKLFVTGDPGCGKTTLIRRVVERLGSRVKMTGFVTEEILGDEGRQGFQGRTLDGRTFLLADRRLESDLRVGPYHVSLDGLDSIGLAAITPAKDTQLVVLDEVGKMESFSPEFRAKVEELIAGPVPLLGTVASHGVGFVKKIRRDRRITLIRMRRRGRSGVLGEVLRRLAEAGVPTTASESAGQSDSPRP
jgi:nucleoside-triphosphatase